MNRYYTLSVQPNLFGGHSLIRSWGRIGSGGQVKIDLHVDEVSARGALERLLKSKRNRGYSTNR